MNRIKHIEFKKELLKDPKVLSEYNDLDEEFTLMREMLNARKKSNKTQAEVAELMETTPSVVSRLESIDYQKKHSPSFDTLKKYAHALGCKLSIKFTPSKIQSVPHHDTDGRA